MGKKVAIIQNRIIKGGRLHVITAMVKVLNEVGIIPDIITLKAKFNVEDTKKFYGSAIEFNLKEILFDVRIPSDFHILYFNKIVSSYIKEYDLIINSSNSSFLLPDNIPIVTMLYYPRKGRLHSKKYSIHFPDGKDKSWLSVSQIFHNLVAVSYRYNKRFAEKEKIIAISEFTRNAAIENYPIRSDEISIIYPPVWREELEKKFIIKKNLMVCSLGRFAKDKRQLEQIKIAERLPEFTFHIMGFATAGDSYLKKCEDYVSINNLANVFLYPNTDFEKMQSILDQSTFFIHSLRNEPFGLVTVQGLSNGCIPIVHNSGGQKEIVTIDSLRFENIDDAVEIFRSLQNKNQSDLQKILDQLIIKARQFSYESFGEKLKPIILKELE